MQESLFSLTNFILILTAYISYRAFQNRDELEKWIFSPYLIKKNQEYYRFLSSGLIHANGMHLILNLFALYMFGNTVEMFFQVYFPNAGRTLYLLLYFGGMIAADIVPYLRNENNPAYRSLGASGAVSAVVFSFILFAPLAPMSFIFVPFVRFPAIVLGVLYLAYSYYASRNINDGIGHEAHLFGGLFGLAFTIIADPSVFASFLTQIRTLLP